MKHEHFSTQHCRKKNFNYKNVGNVSNVKANAQIPNIFKHRQMQTRTTNKTFKTDRFSDVFQTVLSLAWDAKFSNGYVSSEYLAKLQIHSWVMLTCGKFKIVVVFCSELEGNTLFIFILHYIDSFWNKPKVFWRSTNN